MQYKKKDETSQQKDLFYRKIKIEYKKKVIEFVKKEEKKQKFLHLRTFKTPILYLIIKLIYIIQY
jgi:hypothetical protein